MPLIDPADLELNSLRALGAFAGQRVLEIGAGDGRLAWPLAARATLWLAVDTDRNELGVAAADRRDHPLEPLRLLEADGQALPLQAASFDLAFFTWSLCCISRAGMGTALAEAGRVLRPGGQLLDVHPTADVMRLEAWLALRPAVPRDPPSPSDYQRLPLGALAEPETPHDVRSATAALDDVGLAFALEQRLAFDYMYFFNDLDELTEYLEDNDELDLAGDALLERALSTLSAATTPAWLVLIQPVTVTSLRKR
jgi:SAM-dependent methyltransferase